MSCRLPDCRSKIKSYARIHSLAPLLATFEIRPCATTIPLRCRPGGFECFDVRCGTQPEVTILNTIPDLLSDALKSFTLSGNGYHLYSGAVGEVASIVDIRVEDFSSLL